MGEMYKHAKAPTKKSCSYCGSSHPPSQCLAYGKKYVDCGKINHFKEVCRGRRSTAVHNIKQMPDQCEEEDHIPRATKEQFAATKKPYNKTTITQLGIYKVKLEHNTVQKCASSLWFQELVKLC